MILAQAAGGQMNLVLLLVLAVFMIFFVLLPNNQRKKKQRQFLENIRKGDNVVTTGGVHGKVLAVEGDTIRIEIDRGVSLKVDKNFISAENTNPEKK